MYKSLIWEIPELLFYLNISSVEQLAQHLESLIFAATQPIRMEEMIEAVEQSVGIRFKEEDLQNSLNELINRYAQQESALEIVMIDNGYTILTKGAYHRTVGEYLKMTTRRRLSRTAVETLSIIAYKQPVTKTEMEKIRGVSCDYSLQKLLEKELVHIMGRDDGPGRPLLYGTSEKFMDYFGLGSLQELPKLKDFRTPDSEIGEPASEEELVQESTGAAAQSNINQREEE